MFKFTPNFNYKNHIKFNEKNNTVSFYSNNRYEKCEFTVSTDDFLHFYEELRFLINNCDPILEKMNDLELIELSTESKEPLDKKINDGIYRFCGEF